MTLPLLTAVNWEGCLNPCFSGNRFGSDGSILEGAVVLFVLILVLVEIGLGAVYDDGYDWKDYGLNPCFSGNRFGS